MDMFTRQLLTLPLLFLSVFSAFSGSKPVETTEGDLISSEDIDLVGHRELFQRWTALDIQSYQMTLYYGAFSPMKGSWKIIVQEGELVYWENDGNIMLSTDRALASSLIMDKLYQLAEDSYKRIGAFEQETLYSPDGVIRDIRRFVKASDKSIPPTDIGFHIIVKEFKKIEGN